MDTPLSDAFAGYTDDPAPKKAEVLGMRGALHNHPFLELPLDIYEKHMSLDGVRQLQTLNSIMKRQLDCYVVPAVMILGIAGGNGLEHIDTRKYRRVYGVDINGDYLDACRARYPALDGVFEAVCLDLTRADAVLPETPLVIADIVVEYIGYKAFVRGIRSAAPEYISAVLQVNEDDVFVSRSPYSRAFDRVSEIHQPVDEQGLTEALTDIGYSKILTEAFPLPNGKKFVRVDYTQ